jgi:hypothetical protein
MGAGATLRVTAALADRWPTWSPGRGPPLRPMLDSPDISSYMTSGKPGSKGCSLLPDPSLGGRNPKHDNDFGGSKVVLFI